MNRSELPIIRPDPHFIVGEFATDRTLQELDGQAECAGWMQEPRHMLMIRTSSWYTQSIAHFVKNARPYENFKLATKAARFPPFIFWRILDWGCGMNADVRHWLTQYAGESITYALRTRDSASLESVYHSHMRGPRARLVAVAPPVITACVDYAERLFGFHPVTDLASLLPFLILKARQESDRIHDPVYFLSRCVAFMLRAKSPGQALLKPYIPELYELATDLESMQENGPMTERSEYSDTSVLGEARIGLQAILRAVEQQDADQATYLDEIWDLATLDEVYQQLWGVALRDNTSSQLFENGQQEEALNLTQQVLRSREDRFGAGHPQTMAAMFSVMNLFREAGDLTNATAMQRKVLQQYQATSGADDPQTIEAAVRLGDILIKAGRSKDAISPLKIALATADRVVGPDHYLTKSCKKMLVEAFLARDFFQR